MKTDTNLKTCTNLNIIENQPLEFSLALESQFKGKRNHYFNSIFLNNIKKTEGNNKLVLSYKTNLEQEDLEPFNLGTNKS